MGHCNTRVRLHPCALDSRPRTCPQTPRRRGDTQRTAAIHTARDAAQQDRGRAPPALPAHVRRSAYDPRETPVLRKEEER
jgi:hypothetical protein